MEKKSIITGKTLEEAKANVTAQLGLDADSYSYQVVQMPKSGFLGFGGSFFGSAGCSLAGCASAAGAAGSAA